MRRTSLSSDPMPRKAALQRRWAAWTEPRVRAWWLIALVLGIIGFKFVLAGIHAHHHVMWLINDGKRVDAIVLWAGEEHMSHRQEAPNSVVQLEFPWKGNPYQPRPAVLEGRKAFIMTASTLPVYVNPDNPEDWTWLSTPLPLLSRVIGGIITLPMAILALIWAMIKHAGTRRAWRSGIMVESIVVDTRIAAIAPLCQAVRVTPQDMRDNRIYTVYVPRTHPRLASGDEVFILRASPRSRTAVAAAWFEARIPAEPASDEPTQ